MARCIFFEEALAGAVTSFGVGRMLSKSAFSLTYVELEDRTGHSPHIHHTVFDDYFIDEKTLCKGPLSLGSVSNNFSAIFPQFFVTLRSPRQILQAAP